jgi:hypothetical protein
MNCEYCGVEECPAAEHNENCPLYKEYHKFLKTMNTKTTLLLEEDLFSEDELVDTKSIISNYFDVKHITLEKALLEKAELASDGCIVGAARCSLEIARLLGFDFKYANVLNWMPVFRKHTISPELSVFVELEYIKEYMDDKSFKTLFIRPVDPYKTFSGQVFHTKAKFLEEYNFMVKNKNVSPSLLCMIGDAQEIDQEYRCVFVDNVYMSGSMYMDGGKPSIKPGVPEKVVNFAKHLASNVYFQNIFNFVIDVAIVEKDLRLVEINAFETASFYASDLNKIYKKWAETC